MPYACDQVNHDVAATPDQPGDAAANRLLLLLADANHPVSFHTVQDELGVEAAALQLALCRLEDEGLVGLRAPDDVEADPAERSYRVHLEATAKGRSLARRLR